MPLVAFCSPSLATIREPLLYSLYFFNNSFNSGLLSSAFSYSKFRIWAKHWGSQWVSELADSLLRYRLLARACLSTGGAFPSWCERNNLTDSCPVEAALNHPNHLVTRSHTAQHKAELYQYELPLSYLEVCSGFTNVYEVTTCQI